MSDTSEGFTPSDAEINLSNNLALYATIPGTCLSFLALIAYGIVASFRRGRASLNRVSFRLMVYTLVFNVLFGVAYAATPSSPGALCNFGAFAVNFTLSFSTFFTTCIALNLQLVLVHEVNGKQMEKYYILGTAILSIILNVPTYALHQFGYNDDTETCWYSNENPATRLKWIIGTQSFWITLGATIETVCSLVVLVWIYRFQRNTKIMATVTIQHNVSESQGTKMPAVIQEYRPVMIVARNKEYRKVVLRIVMYPIVSLIVNYATVVLDLNMTVHNLNTQHDFNLLTLDLIFYGIRPLVYGILAITDPAFLKGMREIRKNRLERKTRRETDPITQINFATVSAYGESRHTDRDMISMTAQGSVEIKFERKKDSVEDGNVRVESEELLKFERQL